MFCTVTQLPSQKYSLNLTRVEDPLAVFVGPRVGVGGSDESCEMHQTFIFFLSRDLKRTSSTVSGFILEIVSLL